MTRDSFNEFATPEINITLRVCDADGEENTEFKGNGKSSGDDFGVGTEEFAVR